MSQKAHIVCYNRPAAPGPKLKRRDVVFERLPVRGEVVVVDDYIYFVHSVEHWVLAEGDSSPYARTPIIELTTEPR